MSLAIQNVDIELAAVKERPKSLQGYPSFAAFIAQDHDAAIYRKFQHLSARNLLYLQSEIHDLEGQLQALDDEDAKSSSFETEGAARSWHHYASEENARAAIHRELQGTIKVKLKEYHEGLLRESQVLALQKPSSRTLRVFKRWFSCSAAHPVLLGRDVHLFDDDSDLVALAPVDIDRLNIFLRAYFGWFLKEKTSRRQQVNIYDDLYYFPEDRVQFVSAIIATLLSAILLIGAIACLLVIADQGRNLKIGMIVLFTCLFAATVGLLTNAKRAEIFGSTAAYAAVLVVFVSNPIGST